MFHKFILSNVLNYICDSVILLKFLLVIIFCCLNLYFLFSLRISSSHGIQVIEFRDSAGTLFLHLEYPEGEGCLEIDLNLEDLKKHVPDGSNEISVVAEDGVGTILKSKLNILDIS